MAALTQKCYLFHCIHLDVTPLLAHIYTHLYIHIYTCIYLLHIAGCRVLIGLRSSECVFAFRIYMQIDVCMLKMLLSLPTDPSGSSTNDEGLLREWLLPPARFCHSSSGSVAPLLVSFVLDDQAWHRHRRWLTNPLASGACCECAIVVSVMAVCVCVCYGCVCVNRLAFNWNKWQVCRI